MARRRHVGGAQLERRGYVGVRRWYIGATWVVRRWYLRGRWVVPKWRVGLRKWYLGCAHEVRRGCVWGYLGGI